MIHQTGKNFNVETLLEARKTTLKSIDKLFKSLELGMTEQDANQLIDSIFETNNIERKWHPNKIRFNQNTTLSFKEKSNHTKLHDESIFFFDVGPVFKDHEADIGRTYTLSKSSAHQEIIKASEEIFIETARKWKKYKWSGAKLYQFAKNLTNEIGYVFNDKMKGHRIGDFPHALFHKGSMVDLNEFPEHNVWVLEILIRHPGEDYGAFYEDILIV